jgi:hypothetical protein
MPVRPLLDIRIDLIDSLSALGATVVDATRVADGVIDAGGNPVAGIRSTQELYRELDTLPRGYHPLSRIMDPEELAHFLANSNLAPVTPIVDIEPQEGSTREIRLGVPSTPAGTSPMPMFELYSNPSVHITKAQARKIFKGFPMWKNGPPRPGWIKVGLVFTHKSSKASYRVVGFDGTGVQATAIKGDARGLITNIKYRDIHKSWKTDEFILCDECRAVPESTTICTSCGRRKLRKTDDTGWELPKFCETAFDDPDPLPKTRFEREDPI